MNLDDLKEQLSTIGQRIHERLEEQPTYVQLKERFDGLSPQMQKLTLMGVGGLIWLFVLSIPWGWTSNADLSIETFESRRALVRDLLRVSRESADVPAIPPPPPVEALRPDIESRLRSISLLPEQIKAIDVGSSRSQLLPLDKSSGALTVQVTKLNVRQVVDAGTQLARLNPSIKMTALEIKANAEDKRYFDVTYRLTALLVPDLSAPPSEEPPPRGARQ